MNAALLAVMAAGLAGWCAVPPASPLGVPAAESRSRARWWAPGAAGFLTFVVASLGARIAVCAVGVGLLAYAVERLVASTRRRASRRRRQIAVIELCDALAAELHAGLSAQRAIGRACASEPEWAAVATTARLDGDVAGALRAASHRPGARGLRAVAAAWDVSARSGAAFAGVLDRVSSSLRDEQDAAAEVTASVAPARATAKMLAVLPVFGIGLGTSMGAQPLTFLFHSSFGLVCLAGGLVLALSGVLWVERLADAAES